MTPTSRRPDPLRPLEEQLAALRHQDDELAQSLEDTREARRRLAGQIRALEAGISLVRSGGKPADTQLASGTIADAIEALLRAQGEMRAIELTEALQSTGKLLRTDSAYATLHKTLARDQRFKKIAGKRGFWGLVGGR
ncbi:MAG: hypothetical protein WB116_11735 [Candidatus Dormiibacterota bacterium]